MSKWVHISANFYFEENERGEMVLCDSGVTSDSSWREHPELPDIERAMRREVAKILGIKNSRDTDE